LKVYVWVCKKCGEEFESLGEKVNRCPCGGEGEYIGEYEE